MCVKMERRLLKVVLVALTLILLMGETNTQYNQDIWHQPQEVSAAKNRQLVPSVKTSLDIDIAGQTFGEMESEAVVVSMENGKCPTWHNGSGCKCGSDLDRRIICNDTTSDLELLHCYCMTYSKDSNNTLVVGPCMYTCRSIYGHPYNPLPSDPTDLIQQCLQYNRVGQLCGDCKDNFTQPVYSYNFACVDCTTNDNTNWVKYVAIAYVPLTAFFLIVICFKVSATSSVVNVLVLQSQLLTSPTIMRNILTIKYFELNIENRVAGKLLLAVLSFCGIWNLDFLRLIYSPFCLHSEMSSLQVLALDYAIAAYPLLLIVLTYILVELHDHNFRIVVWLWKPFHACFVSFKREWNIRTSLIDAFSTFLLLSYVKFLSVSLDFLAPAQLMNINGQTLKQLYLYYNGTIEYFGKEHLPYGLLAISLSLIFNILPLLLLCLYPYRHFQRCLNHHRLQCQALHTFMDVFHGHYKDGTNNSRDCRWFATLYLMVRITFIVVTITVLPNLWLPFTASLLLILLIMTAVFQPYKVPTQNIIDIFLNGSCILAIMLSRVWTDGKYYTPTFSKVVYILTFILVLVPVVYFVGLIFKLLINIRCVREGCQKLWASIPCKCYNLLNDADSEDSLPDRIAHPEQYVFLLAQSTSGTRRRNE